MFNVSVLYLTVGSQFVRFEVFYISVIAQKDVRYGGKNNSESSKRWHWDYDLLIFIDELD